MTEEIKEMFYKLRSDDYYEKHYQQSVYYEKDLNKLENYITNLQKENEKLKEENKRIFSRVNDDELLISNAMNYVELQDYKSRNKKAIEYIKKDTRWFDSEYAKIYGMLCDCEGAKGDRLEVLVNPTNLLNILQGGDE